MIVQSGTQPWPKRSRRVPATIDAALARFDLRAAADAVWSAVEVANRHVSATRPWKLTE